VALDQRRNHGEAARPTRDGFDEHNTGGRLARCVYEPEALGVKAFGRKGREQTSKFGRRVDEAATGVSTGQLASGLGEPGEVAGASQRLGRGHPAATRRYVRRIAHDEVAEASPGLRRFLHVCADRAGAIRPAVRVEITRGQPRGEAIQFDEDDALSRVEPQETQAYGPDPRPEVERDAGAPASSREIGQEQRVDIGPISGAPWRLVQNDAPAKQCVSRGLELVHGDDTTLVRSRWRLPL